MSYTVFARKWRPQTFSQVIGQSHITTTLQNAIKLNRVAHAYLFSGPRGIGKTSIARIFAKALNCKNGPSQEPCNQCQNCLEITAGNSLDVLEIDGASNRRIDDVREIGDNVKFTPANSRFKIYIIDEVHMLTKEAFNALLKTLEEPPAHVKFIFATTEPGKVIETIVSRCQRFELRRIEIPLIVDNLKKLLFKEGINIKEDILFDIARLGEGSMRDAQSLLDQVISYCGDKIERKDVELVLGLIGFSSVADFAQLILQNKTTEALKFIDDMSKNGKDLYSLLLNLITYFRESMLMKVSEKDLDSAIELTEEEKQKVRSLLKDISLEKMIYILSLLIELESKMKKHSFPRIALEVAVVKLSHMEDLKSLKEMLEEIKNLPATSQPKEQMKTTVVKEEAPVYVVPKQETVVKKINKDSSLEDIWAYILSETKKINMPLGVILDKAMPTVYDSKKLEISFSSHDQFHKESAQKKKNIVEKILLDSLGFPISLEFAIHTEMDQPLNKKEVVVASLSKKELVEHPIVKKTLKVFNGRITDIKTEGVKK